MLLGSVRAESRGSFLAKAEHRLNERIRVPEVRVIDDAGEQLGVLPTDQALKIAQDRGLDLVEVAPTARPPVTRILDYGKFKYEQAKKESEGRKKQTRVVLREVKMKPNIGKHDMDFKLRTAAKLLRAGDKVKLTVMFRGREITHPEIGRGRIRNMMERLEEEESLPLLVEKRLGMEGRFMSVIVAEDKVRAAALAKERAEQEAETAAAAAATPAEGAPAEAAPASTPVSEGDASSTAAVEPKEAVS